jgi:hypothetical protein
LQERDIGPSIWTLSRLFLIAKWLSNPPSGSSIISDDR